MANDVTWLPMGGVTKLEHPAPKNGRVIMGLAADGAFMNGDA